MYKTPCSDRFWKLRCRKSARRCGAKHISKSKVLKTDGLGPLLEVEMLKKCTTFWREAHFEVKSENDGLGALLDVRMSFCVAGIRDSAPCQKWAKSEGFVAVSTTTTTLHYTPLHYNYNYNYNFTTLHYTTLHYTSATTTNTNTTATTQHSTTLITLHYTNYITLRYSTLHKLQLQLQLQLRYFTLHYTTLDYTTLPYLTLHYTHYTTKNATPTTLH